jgi:GT2 family glycosyltransferase
MMEERYYKNTTFSPIEIDGFYFIIDNRPVLHVDRVIRKIWDLCEGRTFKEIYDDLNGEDGVSWYLLRSILPLMIRSDLIRTSENQQAIDPSEKRKEKVKGPLVSIVILNYNGEVHLRECFDSIQSQTYQNLETILVDNASKDHSVDLLQNEYPWVNLIRLEKNMGFTVGNNIGIKKAKGEYILVLNNDTILDCHSVAEAMMPFSNDKRVGAVALKIRLYPLTRFLNSIGNSLRDHGWGSDNYFGQLDLGQHDHHYEVFSACFAAVLLDRKAIEEVGLLHPNYFIYYEDVDWCFRARRLGWKVVSAPQAIVYHKFGLNYTYICHEDNKGTTPQTMTHQKFGSSSDGGLTPFKLRLVLVNRMRFALRNLQFKTGRRWIKHFLKEDFINFLYYLKTRKYRNVLIYTKAYGRLILLFPKEVFKRLINSLTHRNNYLQDREILRFSLTKEESLLDPEGIPLFDVPTLKENYLHLRPDVIELPRYHFNTSQRKTSFYNRLSGLHIFYFYGRAEKGISFIINGEKFYVKGGGHYDRIPIALLNLHDFQKNDIEWIDGEKRFPASIDKIRIKQIKENRMKKVLVISDDSVGTNMTERGIRAWELAKTLSKEFHVTLLAPDLGGEVPKGDFPISLYALNQDEGVREKERENDFIIVQGFVLDKFPFLKDTERILILDLFIPRIIENLFTHKLGEKSIDNRMQIHYRDLQVMLTELKWGDFFICADERQRDLLIDMLTSIQRVNPLKIESDSKLNNLIGIVPLGIPEDLPTRSKRLLKGVIDGIDEEDFVLIWGGGISNQCNMETLIQAMREVSKGEQKIKLFFLGSGHPNPSRPDKELYHQTLNLTKDLGLLDKTIFFQRDWVPYEDRAHYLLEADCGVSTQRTHIENRFSFGTRIRDYIWCGLPVILTESDFLSERIRENGGGIIVPERNPGVLAGAILKMYRDRPFRKRCSEAMKKMGEAYRWSEVAKPLIEFLSQNFMDKKSKYNYITGRLDEPFTPDQMRYEQLEEFHRVVTESFYYKIYRLLKKIAGD